MQQLTCRAIVSAPHLDGLLGGTAPDVDGGPVGGGHQSPIRRGHRWRGVARGSALTPLLLITLQSHPAKVHMTPPVNKIIIEICLYFYF